MTETLTVAGSAKNKKQPKISDTIALWVCSMFPYVFTRGLTADIHDIHHALDTTMNSISMLFNGYLLYLIKNHSAFHVQTYQVLLAVDAALDFLLALMVFVSQPVGSFLVAKLIVALNMHVLAFGTAFDGVVLWAESYEEDAERSWYALEASSSYSRLLGGKDISEGYIGVGILFLRLFLLFFIDHRFG